MEVYSDVVVGEEGRKFDHLVSEILNELVVDVGDPSLEFDGNVFEKKMNAFLLLKYRLYLNHVFVLELPQNIHFLHEFVAFLQTHLVDFSDADASELVGALLTFPEGIVLLHGNDDLFRHEFIIQFDE